MYFENACASKAHILVENWEKEQEERKLKHKQKTCAKASFFYQLPKEVQDMMLAH